MKKFLAGIILLVILSLFFFKKYSKKDILVSPTLTQISPENKQEKPEIPQLTTIAEGLDTPWAIAFLPEGDMLVTERPGTVRYVDANGKLDSNPVATLSKVKEIGEGGLMGIVLHPDFSTNKFVYFYYTFGSEGDDTFNRVVRMRYENKKFSGEEIIVDNIPGNNNHNGGRIKFGPDKNLYITTGDAQEPSLAQDKNSLAGKILRATDNGQPITNNPFDYTQGKPFEKLVYSYGHRNPQGIDWDKDNRLWSTEHGRSGIQSGLDELNFIEPGKNYGWPEIQGNEKQAGMESPILHSGSSTWAPAGAAFVGDSLFFGGLRGSTLYEAVINSNDIDIKEHFKGEFGRIREVIKGPDGMLYITTSNQDGRGLPKSGDDKIIKINPSKL